MQKIIAADFYRTASGSEPVREWLSSLPREERRQVGIDIYRVELGWPIGMPVCRPLGDGLYEVRSHLENRIARVLFCIAGGKMWLLHGFIKKTQATPAQDVKTARQRKSELLGGYDE